MGVPPSDRFLQALRAVAARPPARAATGAGITAAGTCRRSCTPGSSTGPRARPSGLEGDGETGDSPRSPAAGSAVGGSRLGRGLRVTIAVALVLGRRRALAGSAVIGAGCLGHRRAHLARGSSVRRQPGPARHRHGRRPGRGHPPEHRRGQPPRPYQRPGPGRGSRGRRRGPGRVALGPDCSGDAVERFEHITCLVLPEGTEPEIVHAVEDYWLADGSYEAILSNE